MHGGAAGSGAPKAPANGRYPTGLYTQESLTALAMVRACLRASRDMLDGLPGRLLLLGLDARVAGRTDG
jgi:hypothetical protein